MEYMFIILSVFILLIITLVISNIIFSRKNSNKENFYLVTPTPTPSKCPPSYYLPSNRNLVKCPTYVDMQWLSDGEVCCSSEIDEGGCGVGMEEQKPGVVSCPPGVNARWSSRGKLCCKEEGNNSGNPTLLGSGMPSGMCNHVKGCEHKGCELCVKEYWGTTPTKCVPGCV